MTKKTWITYPAFTFGGYIAVDYAGVRFWGRTETDAILARAKRGNVWPPLRYSQHKGQSK